MTVLQACQEAAKLLLPGQAVPTSVFETTDTFAGELGTLANVAGEAITKAHDWRKLMVLKTQAGDGNASAFDLPADYDRMPVKAAIFSTSHQLPLESVQDLDEWLDRELRSFVGSVGYWMILSGQLQIKPVMSPTESIKYYYISSHIAIDEADATKARFTADSDSFRLPERLLTLAIIWRWRAGKGLDYAEDMRNSEIANAEVMAREKGSRIIKVGRARLPDGVSYAYPGTINAP